MKNEFHIFENLVKDENTFTELTYNLLQFKSFRDTFLKFLFKSEATIDSDSINFNDFDTQYGLKEYGRPDLVIVNSNIEILIEIKTYDTGRTKNQPINYLTYLNTLKKEHKVFIFLIPKYYYEEFGCKEDYKNFDKTHPTNTIKKRIVYWQDLKREIEQQELNKLSHIISEYHKLLTQWFVKLQTIFNLKDFHTMYSSQIPQTLKKITDFIYGVQNELKKNGFNTKNKYGNYFEEHGLYIQNSNSDNIFFFGCWLDFWEESSFPIIFGLEYDEDKDLVEQFQKLCKLHKLNYQHYLTEDYNYHLIYFKKELLEKDRQNEIIEIISKFKPLIE